MSHSVSLGEMVSLYQFTWILTKLKFLVAFLFHLLIRAHACRITSDHSVLPLFHPKSSDFFVAFDLWINMLSAFKIIHHVSRIFAQPKTHTQLLQLCWWQKRCLEIIIIIKSANESDSVCTMYTHTRTQNKNRTSSSTKESDTKRVRLHSNAYEKSFFPRQSQSPSPPSLSSLSFGSFHFTFITHSLITYLLMRTKSLRTTLN